MKTTVEKDPHLGVDRPNANARFARRARGGVPAGDRLEDGQPRAGFDSLHEDQAIASESKTIERISRGAEDQPVVVVAAAGARSRGDFGVEVAHSQIVPEAGEINAGLHNNGQAVAADGGAPLV